MSTSISPLTHALRLLQTELAQRRRAQSGVQDGPGAQSPETAAKLAKPTTALQRLPGRLKALRSKHGGLPRAKALRLFIEAALQDELGSTLQLDPAFGDLVERTCRAIEQDASASELLNEALEELEALAA